MNVKELNAFITGSGITLTAKDLVRSFNIEQFSKKLGQEPHHLQSQIKITSSTERVITIQDKKKKPLIQGKWDMKKNKLTFTFISDPDRTDATAITKEEALSTMMQVIEILHNNVHLPKPKYQMKHKSSHFETQSMIFDAFSTLILKGLQYTKSTQKSYKKEIYHALRNKLDLIYKNINLISEKISAILISISQAIQEATNKILNRKNEDIILLYETTLQIINSQKQKLQLEISPLRGELQQITEKISMIKLEDKASAELIKELSQKVQSLSETLRKNEQQIQEMGNKIQSFQEEKDVIVELQEAIKPIIAQITENSQRLSKMRQYADSLPASGLMPSKKLEELKKLEEIIDDIEEEIKADKDKLSKMESRLKKYNLINPKSVLDEFIESPRQQLAELNRKASELQRTIDEAENIIRHRKKEKGELTFTHKNLDQEIFKTALQKLETFTKEYLKKKEGKKTLPGATNMDKKRLLATQLRNEIQTLKTLKPLTSELIETTLVPFLRRDQAIIKQSIWFGSKKGEFSNKLLETLDELYQKEDRQPKFSETEKNPWNPKSKTPKQSSQE